MILLNFNDKNIDQCIKKAYEADINTDEIEWITAYQKAKDNVKFFKNRTVNRMLIQENISHVFKEY